MSDSLSLNDSGNMLDFNEIPNPAGMEAASLQPLKMENPAGAFSELSKPKPVEHRKYEIDGTEISLNFRTLIPSTASRQARTKLVKEGKIPAIPEGKSDEAVIYLPGWASDAVTKTATITGQAFANEGQVRTFVVDTNARAVTSDTLYTESKAIAKFIREQNLNTVTLVGYSEGGIRAANVATILHDEMIEQGLPEIKVKGVVLLDSVGVYKQKPSEFYAGFLKTNVLTAKDLLIDRRKLVKGAQAGLDVVAGIARDTIKTKLNIFSRIKSAIHEMSVPQPRFAKLESPVVLFIHGGKDLVSDPEKVVPGYRAMKPMEGEEGNKFDPREKALQKIFPKSKSARMIVGKGRHALPVLRDEEVARVSLGMIERISREK